MQEFHKLLNTKVTVPRFRYQPTSRRPQKKHTEANINVQSEKAAKMLKVTVPNGEASDKSFQKGDNIGLGWQSHQLPACAIM
jgi:hypothetical protein